MTNPSRAVSAAETNFRGYLQGNAWTACFGAGISRGISPDWQELAYCVIQDSFKGMLSRDEFNKQVNMTGWSLDSWIQAAANKFKSDGRSISEFQNLLESLLYAEIRKKAKGMGLEKYLTTVLNSPKREHRDRVIEVCNFIEDSFPQCSLLPVARTLIACAAQNKGPKAILTFNADTFLETYIDLRLRRDHYLGPGPHGHPSYDFVQVTRPSLTAGGSKIPIIHCHGCISPRPISAHEPRDSRDRLVFLEQEYLAMASGSAAWAETVFLYHAQSTRVAFVGMSMSDSNIRRWMSAIELEKAKDRQIYGYDSRPNPDHIWLRPKPECVNSEEVYLLSLQHLGIRPAWIDSWNDLEAGMRNLTATSMPDVAVSS